MTPLIPPLEEFLSKHHYPPDFGIIYGITAVVLGGVGALMVWLLKETDTKKAIVLGLSLPAFFTTLVGAGDKGDDKPITAPSTINTDSKGAIGILSFFAPTAYADDAVPDTQLATKRDRTIEIVIDRQRFPYRAELLDAGEQVVEAFDVASEDSELVSRTIPSNAVAVRFASGDSVSEKVSFKDAPAGSTVSIVLDATFERKFSFAQALGRAPENNATFSTQLEVRPKAKAGLQGWIYLGQHSVQGWSFRTVDASQASIPKAGDVLSVVFPVNIRDAMRSKHSRLDILSVGQKVKILEVNPNQQVVWAKIEVQPEPSSSDPSATTPQT